MRSQMFEIKIALLGHVSVGKTTILNALFRDKFGEVSMRRTTAGIDYFRVSTSEKTSATFDDTNPRTAESILKEITVDNAFLRTGNDVKEKFFDVELDEEICDMRGDTRLVLIDIPGMNEARTSSKYKDYVARKWQTFDCVVVVMDAKQGVNAQEQVDLLKFVKQNNERTKMLPVIILCNKVDGSDEEELALLVREVREEVERIFQVQARERALEAILKITETSKNPSPEDYPVFIPISAIHAYIYRSASLMDPQQFKRFDKSLIERLGMEEIGKRRWRKLNEEEKYNAVFEVISDPLQYEEGLRASNFDKFLTVLAHCVGGNARQVGLLEKQLEFARANVSSDKCIATQIQSLYKKIKALGLPTENLQLYFWIAYKTCEDRAFDSFVQRPGNVDQLAKPITQLIEYHKWVSTVMDWSGEKLSIVRKLKILVRRQLGVVFEEVEKWHCSNPCSSLQPRSNGKDPIAWKDLLPVDWSNIFESVLLNSGNMLFCELFGREKIFLEQCRLYRVSQQATSSPGSCPCCNRPRSSGDEHSGITICHHCSIVWTKHNNRNCPYCKNNGRNHTLGSTGYCSHCMNTTREYPFSITPYLKLTFVGGKIQPAGANPYKSATNVEVPEELSDPKHFGHLAWKFCRFAANCGQRNAH